MEKKQLDEFPLAVSELEAWKDAEQFRSASLAAVFEGKIPKWIAVCTNMHLNKQGRGMHVLPLAAVRDAIKDFG